MENSFQGTILAPPPESAITGPSQNTFDSPTLNDFLSKLLIILAKAESLANAINNQAAVVLHVKYPALQPPGNYTAVIVGGDDEAASGDLGGLYESDDFDEDRQVVQVLERVMGVSRQVANNLHHLRSSVEEEKQVHVLSSMQSAS